MVYVGGQKNKTRNTLLNNIPMHNMDSILDSMVAFSEGCGQTNKNDIEKCAPWIDIVQECILQLWTSS